MTKKINEVENKTVCDIYNMYSNEESHNGITTLPLCEEVRDKNYNTMRSFLDSLGCSCTYIIRECFDGEEYEITQIRGPKASGFFLKFFIFACESVKSM